MKAKDHTIAATDQIAAVLSIVARINPDNPVQAAFNMFEAVDRLRTATDYLRIAAGQYEAATEAKNARRVGMID